jgi:methyltransferase family protein
MKVPPRIRRLLESKKAVKLDLGCGPSKQADFVGIDTRPLPGVDIVHDLEQFPWPLPDNCAQFVLMSHFFEHVKPWKTLDFMAELHRVCRDGAQVAIAAPYATEYRFVQDPTHCNPSNEATWWYWDCLHPLWGVYRPPVFHVESYELIPVGGMGRDFNCLLRACKPKNGKGCPHQVKPK